jgi:phosphate-selective porin OprO/OprP
MSIRLAPLFLLVATPALAQTAVPATVTDPPTTPELAPAPPPVVAPAPAPAPPALDRAAIAAIVDDELAHRDGITWKDGFHLRSSDGAFQLNVGAYFQFDGRTFAGDDADKNTDTFAFKSIRADLNGTLLDRVDYRLLPDFAGGKVVVQDAWVDVKASTPLKILAGKGKVPFGIERLQGDTTLLFVERALPNNLVPNRDLGVQLHGELAGGKLTYAVGVFDGVPDGGSGDGDVSDDKDAVARVFATPGGGVGVGGAATYGNTHGNPTATDLASYKTTGQATFFQLKTGTTVDDTAIADGARWRATGQGYWYGGPAGVLAEYVHTNQQVAFAGGTADVKADAWQLAATAVVGGTPTYKGVQVAHPFKPSAHQWGAFEFDARYHELRIGDGAFVGDAASVADPAKSARRARAFGLGADWHLSRALRITLDLERTQFEGGAASGGDRPSENVAVGRVQAVF